MFRYQRTIFSLTTRKNINLVPVRFNSSVNNKLQLNNATAPTTVEKEKSLSKPNERYELENKTEISFVPVINIPETEFAHNAFFSLYRPLLGLSDETETPFFSKKTKTEEEVEQEKLDLMLAIYMNNCSPFVEPSKLPLDTQGEDWKEGFLEAYRNVGKETDQVEFTVTEEMEELTDMIEPNESRPLPIFHMPESADVLDYLTSIESNMKAQNAKLDAKEKLKDSRIKKLQILDGVRRLNNQPRFYTSNNRNVHQRLRRYQQRWMLK